MKTISVLGSTGSIGTQSLDVAKQSGFRVAALAAHSNILLLEQQARCFHPRLVCVYDKNRYKDLKDRLSDTDCTVVSGMDGLCEAAAMPEADTVLNAVVGIAGLLPTLAAIEAGKEIALANKETIVTGGELVLRRAAEKGVRILPVDSEHSAIFQCLEAGRRADMRRILLTASGGPFFGKTRAALASVTAQDALQHPNWNMGAKITIDSATLMNKGLELIEAVRLFDCTPEQVEIVVHRESVLHSAVEFADHSVIAQLGVPDMRIPIQYALTYPARTPGPVRRLSLFDVKTLTFAEPDEETFVCLKAARRAIHKGGVATTWLNGANEQAVSLFLEGKIGFLQIGEWVSDAVEQCDGGQTPDLEQILQADRAARAYVLSRL